MEEEAKVTPEQEKAPVIEPIEGHNLFALGEKLLSE